MCKEVYQDPIEQAPTQDDCQCSGECKCEKCWICTYEDIINDPYSDFQHLKVDMETAKGAIIEAQRKIKEWMGVKCYNKLCALLKQNRNLKGCWKTLLCDYLQPAIIDFAEFYYVRRQRSDDFKSKMPTKKFGEEFDTICDIRRKDAYSHQTKVIRFIEKNAVPSGCFCNCYPQVKQAACSNKKKRRRRHKVGFDIIRADC